MDALELVAVAVWSFAVSVAGGLVGLVLGNLRLPLVVLVASSPAAGAGANVAISGLAAVASAGRHARGGRVSWRIFAWMAPPSLAGALAGGLISGVLPDRVLLGAISVVVLYSAYELWRDRRRSEERVPRSANRVLADVVAVGFVVGLLGGIVGLILGSLRLPALVRWAGIGPHEAVGTNAAVGAVVGLGGLLGHLPSGIDWTLLSVGGAAAIPGAYLGARLTGRLDEGALMTAIAAVLVVTGLAMGVQAAVS